jgi:hypothetical protein
MYQIVSIHSETARIVTHLIVQMTLHIDGNPLKQVSLAPGSTYGSSAWMLQQVRNGP